MSSVALDPKKYYKKDDSSDEDWDATNDSDKDWDDGKTTANGKRKRRQESPSNRGVATAGKRRLPPPAKIIANSFGVE